MKKLLIGTILTLFFGLSCDGMNDDNNQHSILFLQKQNKNIVCKECLDCTITKILYTKNPCEIEKSLLRVFQGENTITYFIQLYSGNWEIMEIEKEYTYGCPVACSPCKIKITSEGILQKNCYSYYSWTGWKDVSW